MSDKKVEKNPKSKVISVNINIDTLERLDFLASEFGLSRSSCIAYIVNSFSNGYALIKPSGFKPSKNELKKYAQ